MKRLYGLVLIILLTSCAAISYEGKMMDDEKFWRIISLTHSVNNEDEKLKKLKIEIGALNKEEIQAFYEKLEEKRGLANTDLVWQAANLLTGGNCSDDCFDYFTCWLVSLGKEEYSKVLQNPDVLADLHIELGDDLEDILFENYCFVPVEVYEEKYNLDLYDLVSSEYAEDSISTSNTEDSIKEKLPKLWEKYSPKMRNGVSTLNQNQDDLYSIKEVYVDGVGNIRVGSVLNHKVSGKGVVIKILPGDYVRCVIKFEDEEEEVMLVTSEFFYQTDE